MAVDDFGAGYSTLALLNSWEWTWVKLDRQLLSGDDDADRRVFGHVAHMLSDLDLTAVAEGIERPDQTERVLESGVTLGQGTLYSPPVTAQRVLGDLDRFGLRTSDSAE